MTFDHAIRISKYLLHNQGFVVAKYQNQTIAKAEVFQNLVCLLVSIYFFHNVRQTLPREIIGRSISTMESRATFCQL
jgi:hypothetical protein